MNRVEMERAFDWGIFLRGLVSNLDNQYSRSRIDTFKEIPNFFEAWFTVETIYTIRSLFRDTRVRSNENYGGFSKPDIIIGDNGHLYVIELKHFPTYSREARGRFDGGKRSTAIIDYLKLKEARCICQSVRKLLWLYGPARMSHSQIPCKDEGMRFRCIECMMASFGTEVCGGFNRDNWRAYALKSSQMFLVEVDV